MSTDTMTPVEGKADLATGLNTLADNFPEINPSNYEHDDACALNTWGCEAVWALRDAAARIEALEAALRVCRENLIESFYDAGMPLGPAESDPLLATIDAALKQDGERE